MDIATAMIRRREWREPAACACGPPDQGRRRSAPGIASASMSTMSPDSVMPDTASRFRAARSRKARSGSSQPSASAPREAFRGGAACREAEHRRLCHASYSGRLRRPARARQIGSRPGFRKEHGASQGTVGPRRTFSKMRAMCSARPFDLGQPAADDRRAADHRGADPSCQQDRRRYGIHVMAVDLLHVPSAETEAPACRRSAPTRWRRRPSSGCRPRGTRACRAAGARRAI